MPDEPTVDHVVTEPNDPATDPDTTPTPEGLGDAGKRALDAERQARRDAEARIKELEPLAAKAKELEDANKTELERAAEARTAAEKELADTRLELSRLRVIARKGLSEEAAEFLTGDTEEELEAKADRLLATFGKPSGGAKPPSAAGLRGGLDPTTDPVDVQALVDSIPPTA